ncbi:MAG: hypothetical protein Q8L23_09925 [Caulobacter sp.]|nr:hypothetical protein [Caulobacter sp.]
MTNATDQFIHYLNVKNYNAQLLATQDGAHRAMLLRLLASELAHGRLMAWKPPPGRE